MLTNFKENLKCVLTESEVTELGRRIARANQKCSELRDESKDVAAGYKSKIASHEANINRDSQCINTRYEFRPIDCEVLLNTPCSGRKTIIRTDNGGTVREENMTNAELQVEMEFDAEADSEEQDDEKDDQ